MEQPEGVIITVSAAQFKEKGLRNWVRNFKRAMNEGDLSYWFRQGNQPKQQVESIYICIAGRIAYKITYVES